jgi:hypothetical protein
VKIAELRAIVSTMSDENADGIVALRNHADILLDIAQLAALLFDAGLTSEQYHAARVALRCALAKMEVL